MLFFCLIGLILGVLSSIYSYFILLSSLVIFAYQILFKKKKEMLFFTLFILLGVLIIFLNYKGMEGEISTFGIVIKSSNNYYLLKTFKGNYYVESSTYTPLFSLVRINGESKELSFFSYEGSFDFKGYLNNRNVFYEIVPKEEEIKFKMFSFLYDYKNFVLSFLTDENRKLISQFLFSQGASNLSNYESIYNSGHIILISSIGIHISFLQKLLEKGLIKLKVKHKNAILILVNLFFYVVSSFKFSLLRILLRKILETNREKIKLNNSFNAYLMTFLILILLKPRMILDISIYLPLLICLFNGLTKFYFDSLGRIKRKVYKLIFNFIFLLPIYLIMTNHLNIFSSSINLLFIYPSYFIFLLSIILFIVPIFGIVLNPISTLYISILSSISNIGNIYFGEQFLVITVLYYLFLSLYFITKFYGSKKIPILLLNILVILIFSQPLDTFFPKYEMYFLNVGQGDSTLLRYKNLNIMFDTGGLKNIDLANKSLIPFLKKKRIRKIDAIFITHDDYDHVGALNKLNDGFNVTNVYYSSKVNDYLMLNDLKIYNLNPYKEGRNSNENSGVFYFEIKNKKTLIMGDATVQNEKEIMKKYPNLKIDILKVGHHGSKTSSSFDFLSSISPKIAIISVGANNFYGHPHENVLANLNSLNINYLRTDKEGTIKINF